ncbi:MAG: hypothetical protein RMK30_08820 [Anaerolineae bacterium]|nr:hypothetical protein [Anaerolineae bacterium]
MDQDSLAPGQVKKVVVGHQGAGCADVDGTPRLPPAENGITYGHVRGHRVVILNIHQVILSYIIIHRHVNDLKALEAGSRQLYLVKDDGRPRRGNGVATALAVDEGVLYAATISPEFHPVAGVVGDNSTAITV